MRMISDVVCPCCGHKHHHRIGFVGLDRRTWCWKCDAKLELADGGQVVPAPEDPPYMTAGRLEFERNRRRLEIEGHSMAILLTIIAAEMMVLVFVL